MGSEGSFVDGKKHGLWYDYYRNGSVSTTNYINGIDEQIKNRFK
jgi:antitoxin component YwqK of YwqJK toxin-antitoxin module